MGPRERKTFLKWLKAQFGVMPKQAQGLGQARMKVDLARRSLAIAEVELRQAEDAALILKVASYTANAASSDFDF